MNNKHLLNTLAVAALLAVPVSVSLPSTGWSAISEMLVTARKREENLQEIPVAVTAYGELQIEREAIRDIADVAALTPSLQFDQGFWPSDTRVSIRGLFARAGRPSAAVLVDGIDAMSESLESAGGSSMLSTRLLDIERIEVVKGPQSALYGRGAFAGAVNYVTRRPNMEELDGQIFVDLAEYGRYEVRGAISGPVIEDKLAIRLNAADYGFDGFYDNQVTGQKVGGSESTGFGASFLLTPSDAFSLYTNVMYSEDDNDPQAVAAVTSNAVIGPYPGDTRTLNAVVGVIDANESMINQSPDPRTGSNYDGTSDELLRVNVVAEWDLGWGTFKSLTGYVDNEHSIRMDTTQQFGIGGGNNTDANYLQSMEQWSQEFQLLSNDDGPWTWMLGVQGFWEEAQDTNNSRFWNRDPANIFCGFGAACSFADSIPAGKIIDRDTKSYSVFGLVGWDVTEQLSITAEARYIYDEVEVQNNKSNTVGELLTGPPMADLPGFTDKVDDSNLLPRLSIDYAITDDALIYASVAKGIKPPTFDLADLKDPAIKRVDTEELWSYEIGAKTTWPDQSLTLNSAVFFHDYKDQQILAQFPPPPGGFLPESGVVNAGSTEIFGVELEALWQPVDQLTLSASYTYTDGEYEDLNLAEAQVEGVAVSSSNAIKAGNAEGDFSGNSTPGNPDHAFAFSGKYEEELANGIGWFSQLSGRYQGDRFGDVANLTTLENYWIFDAQIGLTGENWELIGYVENLADDDTVQYAQEFIDQRAGLCFACGFTFPVAYYAYLPPPRVFGVRSNFRF